MEDTYAVEIEFLYGFLGTLKFPRVSPLWELNFSVGMCK